MRAASHPPTTTAMPKKMNAIARAPTSALDAESRVKRATGYAAAIITGTHRSTPPRTVLPRMATRSDKTRTRHQATAAASMTTISHLGEGLAPAALLKSWRSPCPWPSAAQMPDTAPPKIGPRYATSR